MTVVGLSCLLVNKIVSYFVFVSHLSMRLGCLEIGMNIFVHLFRLSQYVVFNVQLRLFLISHYIPKVF